MYPSHVRSHLALTTNPGVQGGRAMAGAMAGTALALGAMMALAKFKYGTVQLQAEREEDLVRILAGHTLLVGTLASVGAYVAAPTAQKAAAATGTAVATVTGAGVMLSGHGPGAILLGAPIVGAAIGAQFSG